MQRSEHIYVMLHANEQTQIQPRYLRIKNHKTNIVANVATNIQPPFPVIFRKSTIKMMLRVNDMKMRTMVRNVKRYGGRYG